jgi:hypothetical protein
VSRDHTITPASFFFIASFTCTYTIRLQSVWNGNTNTVAVSGEHIAMGKYLGSWIMYRKNMTMAMQCWQKLITNVKSIHHWCGVVNVSKHCAIYV